MTDVPAASADEFTEITSEDLLSGNAEDFVKKILNLLGVTDDEINTKYNTLIEKVIKFNSPQQFKIINDNTLNRLVDLLINADKNIKKYYDDEFNYKKELDNEWTNMISNLAEIQTLAVLEKVITCDQVVDTLKDMLSNKLKSVNQLLEANHKHTPSKEQKQQGGNEDYYRNKYQKYKSKYLKLKQNFY